MTIQNDQIDLYVRINDDEPEQTYTQEDYDQAQRDLLNWMVPIIQRMTTKREEKKAA